MRIVNIDRDVALKAFAVRAAQDFSAHPNHFTFADGDPAAYSLLAIRWNAFTVMVVHIDEEPLLFDKGTLNGGGVFPPVSCTP